MDVNGWYMHRYNYRDLENTNFTVLYVPKTLKVRLFVGVRFLGNNHKCSFHHNSTLISWVDRFKPVYERMFQYIFDIPRADLTANGNYEFVCRSSIYAKLERKWLTLSMNKTVQIRSTQGT